jgi:aspartate racemase
MAEATLGIIGGIAPGSTIDYYRLLVERYRERRPDGSYPSIVINSINLTPLLEIIATGDRARIVEHLMPELDVLHCVVFDELAARSPVPLVSIVDATAAEAVARGLKKVGLLGTRTTMGGGFYPAVCARHAVTVVIPQPDDFAYVNDKYFGELVGGQFRQDTRDGILAVMRRMQERDGIDGVILGGTELPLLFREAWPAGLPLLDTTRIHVEAALDRLLAS